MFEMTLGRVSPSLILDFGPNANDEWSPRQTPALGANFT